MAAVFPAVASLFENFFELKLVFDGCVVGIATAGGRGCSSEICCGGVGMRIGSGLDWVLRKS